jgi:mitochondrial fission protein ELM1
MTRISTPEVWVITDDKAGHKNQVIGVAEALGYPYLIKNLVYNKKANLPNFLKSDSLATIERGKSDKIAAPWPDIIISAGRKTVPIVKYIKKQALKAGKKKCILVQLMWPGSYSKIYDIIAVPEHDNISASIRNKPNVLTTIGAPHRINKEMLLNEAKIWHSTLEGFPSPKLAVFIGGATKNKNFDLGNAGELTEYLMKILNHNNGSVFVSTSRRTPEMVSEYISSSLRKRYGKSIYFHDYNKSKANPYYAFLGHADVIIVTGDSISMCSEVCSAGKPVYIYSPPALTFSKHKNLHETLYKEGFAKPLDAENLKSLLESKNLTKLNKKPLETAKIIAEKIEEILAK